MIKIDKLLDAISNFLKDRLEQTKGDIINMISSIIAKLISFLVLILILLFALGFTSIAVGNYLNSIFESEYLGYGVISLFYVIIFIILFRFSKSGKLKNIIESEFNKGLKN